MYKYSQRKVWRFKFHFRHFWRVLIFAFKIASRVFSSQGIVTNCDRRICLARGKNWILSLWFTRECFGPSPRPGPDFAYIHIIHITIPFFVIVIIIIFARRYRRPAKKNGAFCPRAKTKIRRSGKDTSEVEGTNIWYVLGEIITFNRIGVSRKSRAFGTIAARACFLRAEIRSGNLRKVTVCYVFFSLNRMWRRLLVAYLFIYYWN